MGFTEWRIMDKTFQKMKILLKKYRYKIMLNWFYRTENNGQKNKENKNFAQKL